MAENWNMLEELLVGFAEDDLIETGEVHPVLVAFAGDRLRFLAWLRPFDKGAYHDPLIELVALAMPLDADRLALSIAGRAWSLEDPIPPVNADADLRQRVHMIHAVDGAGGTPRVSSTLRGFDLDGDGVSWQEPHRLENGEGWILGALELAVTNRAELATDDAEIARQARRVVALGHDLHLDDDIAERLLAAPAVQ